MRHCQLTQSLSSTIIKKRIKLYDDKEKSEHQVLPRSVPYGIGQDGPGNFLTSDDGAEVALFGNTWKAFSIQNHTVSRRTILEFDFQLDVEAEGESI